MHVIYTDQTGIEKQKTVIRKTLTCVLKSTAWDRTARQWARREKGRRPRGQIEATQTCGQRISILPDGRLVHRSETRRDHYFSL